ncbi:MAG TPA: DUF1015 domain-containing protein [Candidatus Acidoferrales bacterium]|nr:DUF1015 domain-containing protein [Candidatus Acidoferrales bacterium]
MVAIAPFRALRYNPKRVSDIAKVMAPPYDVISPEEQERLYRSSPYNIVRLILSREPNPYEHVGALFREWQQQSVLVRDERPAIYFLKQRFQLSGGEEKERQGFFALARLEDFAGGSIHPHERTLEAPKEDRLKIMLACDANLSSIFALYADPRQSVDRILNEQTQGLAPVIEARGRDGVACQLWAINDADVIRAVQKAMADKRLLIADGHHRYEASLRYREHWQARLGRAGGSEAFNYVLMYFVNLADKGLVILPTHRLVRGFAPIAFRRLEETLQQYFYLEPYPKNRDGRRDFLKALKSSRRKRFLLGASFSGDPRYLILRLKSKRTMQRLAPDLSASLQELDVSVLHRLILEHILGLTAEEQARPGVIRYLENEEEALSAAEQERNQAAFILNAPDPEQVFTVALRGERLPQKTTFFYPKVPSGLVINKIDPNEQVHAGPEF